MKKLYSIILFVLYFISISCSSYKCVTVDEEIVLYKERTKKNVITKIPSKSIVWIDDNNNSEYRKVKYNGQIGWAYKPSVQNSANKENSDINSTSNSNKPVQVKGYYRKDGTYVKPHTRSSPKRRS